MQCVFPSLSPERGQTSCNSLRSQVPQHLGTYSHPMSLPQATSTFWGPSFAFPCVILSKQFWSLKRMKLINHFHIAMDDQDKICYLFKGLWVLKTIRILTVICFISHFSWSLLVLAYKHMFFIHDLNWDFKSFVVVVHIKLGMFKGPWLSYSTSVNLGVLFYQIGIIIMFLSHRVVEVILHETSWYRKTLERTCHI